VQYPTKPSADELRRSVSVTSAAAAGSLARSSRHPKFSYNDTGSFEEVDEEKVG